MFRITDGTKKSNSQSDRKYFFQPEADITAYEIARLLPLLIAAWKNESNLDTILVSKEIRFSLTSRLESLFVFDPLLKRHFYLLDEQVDLLADTNS